MNTHDPYIHHPELRGQIKPAEQSFFRNFDIEDLDRKVIAAGMPPDWRTPCDLREAGRRAVLQTRRDRDLWIFGYGSLMWDPSIEFAEVRQAHCPGFQRSFCLWDEGGRGTAAQPALMLGLDEGGACDGLAFRIEAHKLEHETFVLFRREMIAGAYRPEFVTMKTGQGAIEALCFVANRDHDRIKPGIPQIEQARMIAAADGILGTNFAYLADTYAHLALLGIVDPYIDALHAQTDRLRSGRGAAG